jgi:hypothetical protein
MRFLLVTRVSEEMVSDVEYNALCSELQSRGVTVHRCEPCPSGAREQMFFYPTGPMPLQEIVDFLADDSDLWGLHVEPSTECGYDITESSRKELWRNEGIIVITHAVRAVSRRQRATTLRDVEPSGFVENRARVYV